MCHVLYDITSIVEPSKQPHNAPPPKKHKRPVRTRAQACGMCETVWHKLRSPFVLQPSSVGFHACALETFNMGLARCTLCGSVYRCSAQLCCQLVQIEDATVCEITGCVVHHRNLVANEFDNTAMLRTARGGAWPPPGLGNDIERHVRQLLTSRLSRDAHELELVKIANKFRGLVAGDCAVHSCVFACLEASMRRLHSVRVLPQTFDLAEREALVRTAMQHIAFLVVSTRWRMPHMLRGMETRTLVFGLLYLMRTGMTAHSVCLMQAIPKLVHLLPNESLLPKLFGFKAKHITEVENRFKYMLRLCSAADIQRMGFRDVDVGGQI